MSKEDEKKIKMVSAVSEVLRLAKANSWADHHKLIDKMTEFVKQERDSQTKVLMMSAVSKALSIKEKNKMMSEKEIIKNTVKEFSNILQDVEGNLM